MATVVKIPGKTLLVVFGDGGTICDGLGAMWLYQVREGKLSDTPGGDPSQPTKRNSAG